MTLAAEVYARLMNRLQEKNDAVRRMGGTLVVSCQAADGEPLCDPSHIKALALSAIMGGAGGLRLEGKDNISAVRSATTLPIIGLAKSTSVPDSARMSSVYITATFDEAEAIAKAGADIIAIDATGRPRPDGLTLPDVIARIHKELGKPVMGDISTLAEGENAVAAGADLVSTTLHGYTQETKLPSDAPPAVELLRALVKSVNVPIILEGRVWQPEEVRRAFADGAYAVVVGSAITRPQLITERFVRAIPVPTAKDSQKQ
jgi:N-acylglucosamine-6-phosphate 2-epimerase